jgi:hypothetical protein
LLQRLIDNQAFTKADDFFLMVAQLPVKLDSLLIAATNL